MGATASVTPAGKRNQLLKSISHLRDQGCVECAESIHIPPIHILQRIIAKKRSGQWVCIREIFRVRELRRFVRPGMNRDGTVCVQQTNFFHRFSYIKNRYSNFFSSKLYCCRFHSYSFFKLVYKILSPFNHWNSKPVAAAVSYIFYLFRVYFA